MIQKLRAHKSLQGTLLIAPTLVLMITLLIIPIVITLITSFGVRDADGNVIYTFTLDNYIRLMGYSTDCQGAPPPCFNSIYLNILWRSFTLAFQVTTLVILLGYPLAYFIARSSKKNRNTFLFLVLVPLWTNFVIRVYAWIILLREQGVINNIIGFVVRGLGGTFEPLPMLYTSSAVLIGLVYEFLPFMILPIYTSLEKIDGALFEAAADLGANSVKTFLRITLPLSMPGITAGVVLVFIPVMGSFVVSDILGGGQTVLVGNLIQQQFLDARNPVFGSAASLLLMLLTLIVTIFYTRTFGFGEEIASA